MTLNELIQDAYTKNGQKAAGEVIDPDLADFALRESNRMLDQWNVQSLFIWTTDILTFPLTARTLPKYWFTIGPAALAPLSDPVDFDAPRPTRIERANILLQSSSPASRIPLIILNDMQWSDETVPALGTTLPNKLYDDYSDPISRLYIYPYPTITQNLLELFVWHQVPRFVDLTDTFQMPPGYEDAFMLTLSERLLEGLADIPPSLAYSASRARANVRSLNSQAPKISTIDSGMPGRRQSTGNFYNGWPAQLP